MLKFDRTYSTSGNLFDQKEEATHYVGMSKEEIGKVFAYLNSGSYDYPFGNPILLKWTKRCFQCAKSSHGEYFLFE